MIDNKNKSCKEQRYNNNDDGLAFKFTSGRPTNFGHLVLHIVQKFYKFLDHKTATRLIYSLNLFITPEIIAGLEGLEPPTSGFGVRRTSQIVLQASTSPAGSAGPG